MALRRSAGLFNMSKGLEYKKLMMQQVFEKRSFYLMLWAYSPEINTNIAYDTVISPILEYCADNKIYAYAECFNNTIRDLFTKNGFIKKNEPCFKLTDIKMAIMQKSP